MDFKTDSDAMNITSQVEKDAAILGSIKMDAAAEVRLLMGMRMEGL